MTVPTDDTQGRLARLPDRHRAALRAALAGFDDADLAALLGIPPEAVRTTLRLAAAKLVTALAERPARGAGPAGGAAPPSGARPAPAAGDQ